MGLLSNVGYNKMGKGPTFPTSFSSTFSSPPINENQHIEESHRRNELQFDPKLGRAESVRLQHLRADNKRRTFEVLGM